MFLDPSLAQDDIFEGYSIGFLRYIHGNIV